MGRPEADNQRLLLRLTDLPAAVQRECLDEMRAGRMTPQAFMDREGMRPSKAARPEARLLEAWAQTKKPARRAFVRLFRRDIERLLAEIDAETANGAGGAGGAGGSGGGGDE